MRHNLKKIAGIVSRFFDRLFEPLNRGGRWLGNKILGLFGKFPYRIRGKATLHIAVVLFAAALTVWVGYGLFSGLDTPIQTVQAVEYTAAEGCGASGYLVREETVLYSQGTIFSPVLAEGQKVGVGQTVAMNYLSTEARDQQMLLTEKESELQQLTYAGSGAEAYDLGLMDIEISQLLTELARGVNQGELIQVSQTAPALKGLVLRRFASESELAAIRTQIAQVQQEILTLRGQISGAVSRIEAPAAGYFSVAVDGFESLLSPRTATTLSVSAIQSLKPDPVSQAAVGKLISGEKWYYLCLIPAARAEDVRVGASVGVRFTGDEDRTVEMQVVSVSQEENGQCAVLLSADHYLQDYTAGRTVTAEVIFKTHEGLRVPKQAVRVDENGKVGVYVLEGANASWKTVEILYDNGKSYIVTLDKSSTYNLWPGDEIIVTATDLYDGKVVF